MDKMEKSNTRSLVLCQEDLPPCRVCDAPSTGIHYGVISCDACKAYFRRNAPRIEHFECAEDQCCVISYKNRTSCPYCRIQKCLKVGMSKEGIKTGRRTREVSNAILKVKKSDSSPVNNDNYKSETLMDTDNCSDDILSRLDIMKNNALILGSNVDASTIGSNVNSLSSTAECTADKLAENKDMQSNDSSISELVKLFESYTFQDEPLDTKLVFESSDQKNKSNTSDNNIHGIDTDNFLDWILDQKENNSIEDCIQFSAGNDMNSGGYFSQLYDSSKIEIYEKVIQRMFEKHKSCTGGRDISVTLTKTEQDYVEMVELKKKIFGSLRPLSTEEYVRFYKETGLDLDGRRELMLRMLPLMENSIYWDMDFMKSIPGFHELCMEDQIEMFKAAQIESFVISCHKCFNLEHKIFSPLPGLVFHSEDMVKCEGEAALNIFSIQKKVQDLKLTPEETTVVAALTVVSGDDCRLLNRTAVEKIQDFLLKCLFYLYDKHHPEDKTRFIRLINCLIEVKRVREERIRTSFYSMDLFTSIVNFPPILSEVFQQMYAGADFMQFA